MKGTGDTKIIIPASLGCIALGVFLFYAQNPIGGVLAVLAGLGLAYIGR